MDVVSLAVPLTKYIKPVFMPMVFADLLTILFLVYKITLQSAVL